MRSPVQKALSASSMSLVSSVALSASVRAISTVGTPCTQRRLLDPPAHSYVAGAETVYAMAGRTCCSDNKHQEPAPQHIHHMLAGERAVYCDDTSDCRVQWLTQTSAARRAAMRVRTKADVGISTLPAHSGIAADAISELTTHVRLQLGETQDMAQLRPSLCSAPAEALTGVPSRMTSDWTCVGTT